MKLGGLASPAFGAEILAQVKYPQASFQKLGKTSHLNTNHTQCLRARAHTDTPLNPSAPVFGTLISVAA